jgi:hypothetical protein
LERHIVDHYAHICHQRVISRYNRLNEFLYKQNIIELLHIVADPLIEVREGLEIRKVSRTITIKLTWHPPRKKRHAYMQETIYIQEIVRIPSFIEGVGR